MAPRESRRPSIFRDIVVAGVAGIISSVLVGVFLVWQAPNFERYFAEPNCVDPQDLTMVPSSSVTVEAPSVAEPSYVGSHLSDGSAISVWAPVIDETKGATARFDFGRVVDLRLICVVNGQPKNSITYTAAGKVRAVRITSDVSLGGRVSPLAVLGEGRSQDRQPLAFDPGITSYVQLEIVSVYEGQGVLDVSFDPPKWVEPEGRTALAEVEFYIAP